MFVAMCRGNCSTCKVKRTLKVVQSPVVNEPSIVEEEPIVEPVMARASVSVEEPEEMTALSVVPFSETSITENPVIDSYAVKKTRKGLVGKLLGG